MLLLSGIVYWITGAALERQLDARIELEANTLAAEYQESNLDELEVMLRDRPEGGKRSAFSYLLIGQDRSRLGGTLALDPPPTPGWSDRAFVIGPGNEKERFRVLTVSLGNGYWLSVGRDLSQIQEVEEAIVKAFAWAFVATLLLGLLGGLFVSSRFLARVDSMASAAEAIIDGDLKQRLPVQKSRDDLDFLAVTLNRMLDRIYELMESVRQVSNDIAHDLKTPLSRLRHRLEAALAAQRSAEDLRDAISGAIAQTDNILSTFSALLRIAHIEAGTRRSAFAPLDFASLVADVADAFAPSIQDQGSFIKTAIAPGISIFGDKELLTQLLANLLENAIRHTPAGTEIEVRLTATPTEVQLAVSDNGPGVPEEYRERLFDRFYRPEESRTTPGSGLGLSLVKAVANLHGARISLVDNKPGLSVEISFPAALEVKAKGG